MSLPYNNSILAQTITVSGNNTSITGVLTSSSGNFISSLRLNNVDVSVSGHTHSNITITAGSGLAGGGSLAANRTIDIGQGDGISVSADSIAVDSTVVRTTGTQTISGAKTFTAATVFSTGITISSSGTNVPLTITHDGTGNCFVVNDVTGDTSPFVIDSSGNVGIGTTTPTFVNNTYSGVHIHAATATSLKLTNATTGQTATDGFELLQDASGNAYVWNRESTNLQFGTAANARLTISSTGAATFAGQVLFTAGSVSACSVAASSDPNTGLYFPSADVAAVVTNGTERVRVGSGGRVQFFANSEKYGIQINNGSTGNGPFLGSDGADILTISTAAGVERMRIDASGRVGIGGSPNRPLLIVNNGACSMGLSDTSTGGNVLSFNPPQNSNGFAQISAEGANALRFVTNNGERMRIDASGNIGIGTNSPQARLHVFSINDGVQAIFTGAQTVNTQSILFRSGYHTNDGTSGFANIGWIDNTSQGGHLTFGTTTSNSGTTGTPEERMRITSAGDIGIGTSSVSSGFKVDIRGCILSYTIDSDGLITTQGLQTTSGGTGKAAIQIDVNGQGGFAWQCDATSSKILRLISNNGYGASESTLMTVSGNGKITAAGVYNNTVGGTNRDVFVDSGGVIGYVSSIRESKTDIVTLDDVSWLSALAPVSYRYRKRNADGTYSDEADGVTDYGLVAEDVEAVKPELCFYDEVDGEPQLRGVTYSKLITPMLKYIQQLEQRIAALEERINV
jgi:hypothetical protein